MSAIDALAKSIATTATGYAAIINGALAANTVSETRQAAAAKGLAASGVPAFVVMMMTCNEEGCDCIVKAFEGHASGGRIASVKIEVIE
jgi:hypothetical protein